jgi:hypothetical protein
MGVIIKDIEVEGDKGKAVLRTLFDTGASHSLGEKGQSRGNRNSCAIGVAFAIPFGQRSNRIRSAGSLPLVL